MDEAQAAIEVILEAPASAAAPAACARWMRGIAATSMMNATLPSPRMVAAEMPGTLRFPAVEQGGFTSGRRKGPKTLFPGLGARKPYTAHLAQ